MAKFNKGDIVQHTRALWIATVSKHDHTGLWLWQTKEQVKSSNMTEDDAFRYQNTQDFKLVK